MSASRMDAMRTEALGSFIIDRLGDAPHDYVTAGDLDRERELSDEARDQFAR